MDEQELKTLLQRCVDYHGHSCRGQIFGVRIARKGMELAVAASARDMIVVVENDRCIADAIQVVTGTRIGRRTMKLVPYGRMAATFVNLKTSRAFRVNLDLGDRPCDDSDMNDEALLMMPDEDLLRWREVRVDFPPHELPGKPQRVVRCTGCAEKIFDFRDLPSSSGPRCVACAQGAYYVEIDTMTMQLYEDLQQSIQGDDCAVRRVVIGLHWTVVQSRHLGMAHTFRSPSYPEVEDAGRLVGQSALAVAGRLLSWNPLEASLGLAALNSMIGPRGTDCDLNHQILDLSRDRTVVVVGRFPSPTISARVARTTHCLELDPQPDELPATAAEAVIPGADLVVITATALINKTMPRLLDLSRNARCIVLGPSTPMNEVLLDHGAEILEGVRLTDAEALTACIGQGVKKFRRLLGIQPITLARGE